MKTDKLVPVFNESMKVLSGETDKLAEALYWQIRKEREFLQLTVCSNPDERTAAEWNLASYRAGSLLPLDKELRLLLGEDLLYPIGQGSPRS